jgi:ATP-dependent protease Clp ATPase subunit
MRNVSSSKRNITLKYADLVSFHLVNSTIRYSQVVLTLDNLQGELLTASLNKPSTDISNSR